MLQKKTKSKVWVDMVTRKDAIHLCKWWNSRSKTIYEEYEIRRSPSNSKFWAVYKV